MVAPNELRIGNRINYIGNHRFEGFFNEEFARYLFDVKDEWQFLEPIPLTEEWLLKFGFNRKLVPGCDDLFWAMFENDYGRFDFEWTEGNFFLFMDGDVSMTLKHITYVHQLQNLYFTLTGKELELKELVK